MPATTIEEQAIASLLTGAFIQLEKLSDNISDLKTVIRAIHRPREIARRWNSSTLSNRHFFDRHIQVDETGYLTYEIRASAGGIFRVLKDGGTGSLASGSVESGITLASGSWYAGQLPVTRDEQINFTLSVAGTTHLRVFHSIAN